MNGQVTDYIYNVSGRFCLEWFFKFGLLNVPRFWIFLVLLKIQTPNYVWGKKNFRNSQKRKKNSSVLKNVTESTFEFFWIFWFSSFASLRFWMHFLDASKTSMRQSWDNIVILLTSDPNFLPLASHYSHKNRDTSFKFSPRLLTLFVSIPRRPGIISDRNW